MKVKLLNRLRRKYYTDYFDGFPTSVRSNWLVARIKHFSVMRKAKEYTNSLILKHVAKLRAHKAARPIYLIIATYIVVPWLVFFILLLIYSK